MMIYIDSRGTVFSSNIYSDIESEALEANSPFKWVI